MGVHSKWNESSARERVRLRRGRTVLRGRLRKIDALVDDGLNFKRAADSTGPYRVKVTNGARGGGNRSSAQILLNGQPLNLTQLLGAATEFAEAELPAIPVTNELRVLFPSGDSPDAEVTILVEDSTTGRTPEQPSTQPPGALLSTSPGSPGMRILRAIVAGERSPQVLAAHRDVRCAASDATLRAALTGHYRPEHVFALRQALELYGFHQDKIAECDTQIETALRALAAEHTAPTTPLPAQRHAKGRNEPTFDVRTVLHRLLGADLSQIHGFGPYTVLRLIAECGDDMTRYVNVSAHTAPVIRPPGRRDDRPDERPFDIIALCDLPPRTAQTMCPCATAALHSDARCHPSIVTVDCLR